jgi:putative endopeptidase
MKKFYHSMLHLNTSEESKQIALTYVTQLDIIRQNKNNLWKLLGLINSNEIIAYACPFNWTLNPDDKDPTIFRCYMDAPQLSLIDLDLYFDDGTEVEYKRKYLKEFFEYLNKLFINVFGENHGYNIKDVYDVEVKIITTMGCEYETGKNPTTYNKVYKDEAMKKYNFNWKEFAHGLGFKKTPDFFITSNLSYLKCGTDLLLNEWDSEQWKTYWVYIYIRQQQRFSLKGRPNWFNFQESFVRGQLAVVSIKLATVYGLGFAFNTFLTNKYIENYKDNKKIHFLQTMSEDLKQVFIGIIKRNKWLQPITKTKALQKLYNFKFTIGSPELLREDPILDYSNTDCWGNLLLISSWRHKQAIELEGKKVIDIPVIDWATTPPKFVGSQAYVVNASYTPSKNGIYVPLGYIQEPFVDLNNRGIEWNLAHLGFTLAHEMSHSLDDWGSQYDENGKLNNWWTLEDKKKFKAIQKDVIKQYEVFASYDGIKFDAAIGIGEDLADISGLNICLEYLRDFQLKNNDILPIQNLSFRSFFVYFAHQMRQKLSKKAIVAQLKTNPHPLDKYRTNVPLSRLPVFRIIYDVKKGDKMWWPSTNRVWED